MTSGEEHAATIRERLRNDIRATLARHSFFEDSATTWTEDEQQALVDDLVGDSMHHVEKLIASESRS